MDVLTSIINNNLNVIGLPIIPLNQFILFLFGFNLLLLVVVFLTLWLYILIRNLSQRK